MPVSFNAARTRADFDALSPAALRRAGSLKWSQYPGDVIAAWVAEMDLGIAPAIAQALERAVSTGVLGYMPGELAARARAAVARYHRRAFGWPVPVEDISLLPDVLSVMHALIAHHTRPDSAVIVPTPAYMPFLSIPGQHGRRCLQVPAVRERDAHGAPQWRLDLEGIESAMKQGAGLLVLCNPWNPVGAVLSPAELDAVAELSATYGVVVFSDEIHSSLIVDRAATHTPYASRPGADPALTFTATAVSKGWNVPGLRCAQLIASGPGREAWNACALSADLEHGASILGVHAVIAALSEPGLAWNETVRDYIHANGELVAEALAPVEGVEVTIPQGTYLAWLDCSDLPLPEGTSPAAHFRREPGVAMSPGRAFGAGYESFCRLNLATGRSIEVETASRIGDAVARLHR